jgi:hypothetical protein
LTANPVQSTIDREKLDNTELFNSECVTDELNCIEDNGNLIRNLNYFYDKTGIQVYIYLKEYDVSLDSETSKEQWVTDYATSLNDEKGIVFVYFAEPRTDETVGYMSLHKGLQTGVVIDTEAEEIFWKYLDKYWYSDISDTGSVLASTFKATSDNIMKHKVSKKAYVRFFSLIFMMLVVVCGTIIKIVMLIHKRQQEKAEETERILKTPMKTLVEEEIDKDL